MSKKFLTFKTDSRRQPTGELPDLVIADELKPSKNLAVVLKPEEIMTQRQAFDTFVGVRVVSGEQVFYWRVMNGIELPEPTTRQVGRATHRRGDGGVKHG